MSSIVPEDPLDSAASVPAPEPPIPDAAAPDIDPPTAALNDEATAVPTATATLAPTTTPIVVDMEAAIVLASDRLIPCLHTPDTTPDFSSLACSKYPFDSSHLQACSLVELSESVVIPSEHRRQGVLSSASLNDPRGHAVHVGAHAVQAGDTAA